jgi:choline dehydrogenase-like flavoprotein
MATDVKTATRIVRRNGSTTRDVAADICIVGAGSAGISAALEAAKLGLKVALVDGMHALGGQAVNSVIGTFCGFYSNGPNAFQTVHGIADGILRDLGAQDMLFTRYGGPRTRPLSCTMRWRSRAGSRSRSAPPASR